MADAERTVALRRNTCGLRDSAQRNTVVPLGLFEALTPPPDVGLDEAQ